MSRLMRGNEIRGGEELLNFLLKRNKPEGVIPKPLLQQIVDSLTNGMEEVVREWRDAEGNVITQRTSRNSFHNDAGQPQTMVNRVLDMNGLINGNRADKAHWPLALAFCIIGDVDYTNYSTAEHRKWWLWETSGGNFILVTHDHEGLGQFRYWINPDD